MQYAQHTYDPEMKGGASGAVPYNDLESGGQAMPAAQFGSCADCPPEVRAGFIRKVYGILSIQLLFTALASAWCSLHQPTRMFVIGHPPLMYLGLFASIGFIFALFVYKNRHPLNMNLLAGFTICEAYTVGVICAMYSEMGLGIVVLQAVLLTAAVFVALTTYVHATKKDFSWLGGGLFAALFVLLFWSLLNSIMGFGMGGQMIFSLVGALIFIGYILYDTSNLIHVHGPDDYIIATVSLYLDIINLFLYLLQLLQSLQGGDS